MKFLALKDGAGIAALGFTYDTLLKMQQHVNSESEQYGMVGTACIDEYDTNQMDRAQLLGLLEAIIACRPEIGGEVCYGGVNHFLGGS